jgi:cell fate (sporulation/competence/biofilm development) regulator YlbF (YheA/YmcA/DUF963 family)
MLPQINQTRQKSPYVRPNMATDDQIMKAASELGELLGEHAKVARLEAAISKLKGDTEAQRALNDLNRHLQAVGEKEMSGQPIEVADKRRIQELQTAVVHNLVLREFQLAQMDYVDLVRRLDDAMYGRSAAAQAVGVGGGAGEQVAAESPLANPDLT